MVLIVVPSFLELLVREAGVGQRGEDGVDVLEVLRLHRDPQVGVRNGHVLGGFFVVDVGDVTARVGDAVCDALELTGFVDEVDWKVSKGGNSGCFYLAQEVTTEKDGKVNYEPIYISCPEYQLLDNANHPDAKLGKNNNRQSASLYDMIPAVPQNQKPFGEWNEGKVMVYKGTVVHGQNGENVVEYHLWTQQWTDMLQASKFSQAKWPLAFELLNNCGGENHEGYIGFQDHGDDIWIRNVRIKIME